MKTIIDNLNKRIAELNQADAKFCKDRWNMSLPEFQRNLAREESNKVTFARQELEAQIKLLQSTPPQPKKTAEEKSIKAFDKLLNENPHLVDRFMDEMQRTGNVPNLSQPKEEENLSCDVKAFIVEIVRKDEWHYDSSQDIWTQCGYKNRTTDELFAFYKQALSISKLPSPPESR